MSHMFKILAVVGWCWTALFGAYLAIRLRRNTTARGFDVVQQHEKLP
ncbi:MAG TPA: hypothetical protein VHD56_12360 [Tepidisphaeraceae bacterium]|nr:hypothetical protein [Tepidisphaeraceae bacterium]